MGDVTYFKTKNYCIRLTKDRLSKEKQNSDKAYGFINKNVVLLSGFFILEVSALPGFFK